MSYELYILVLLMAVCGLVFVLTRLLSVRLHQAMGLSADVNSMMSHALGMRQWYVIEYDLTTMCLRNHFGQLLPDNGLTPDELLMHVDDAQRELIRETVKKVRLGQTDKAEIRLTWNATPAAPDARLFLNGHALLERDDVGTPRFVVFAMRDETTKVEEELRNIDMANRYKTIFDINIVAMSFYGPDGILIDANRMMKQLCSFEDKGEEFFRQISLFDTPSLRNDYDRNSHDTLHVCQHMRYPEVGIDKYIEFRVMPTFNDDGELVYYVVTARDITDGRLLYLQQHRNDLELQATNAAIGHYERELRYLLEKSNMLVWRSYPQRRTIEFSHSLNTCDFSITFDEYVNYMYEDERPTALAALAAKDGKYMSFNVVHHFYKTPIENTPKWFAISGLPLNDDKGSIVGHFGVLRDITPLMNAMEKLRKETQRAENSGIQKSTFLANMTHEIRTPLNAIVGFSDLLPMIDNEEEKRELIRIIRNNCDMLFRLINDILEASNIDSKPLDIMPADVDFAQAFDDICQTLAQRVQEPGVEFVKENPYDTFPTHLDKGRMQQVITNFVTNAVKYTHQGHIKVGYRRTPLSEALSVKNKELAAAIPSTEGLLIYCEDTGAGIPKEQQAAVFDRFVKLNEYVQGTGLGLSICKAIANQLGGKIGVFSEGEGCGSTFWFWMPMNQPQETSTH